MEKWSVCSRKSTYFLLSRHWTDYLVNLSLVQREPGKIPLVFPFCWVDSRNIFNTNLKKCFYQLIWEYGQEGTFIFTTVLLYAQNPPWNHSRLTITRLHPNDFLLPGVIEWRTALVKEKANKQKKSPQHTDVKRGLRECFFLCYICFLERIKLESQHKEDRTAKLPRSWQVATRLIPTYPFCGDAYQKSLLRGGYGKNRYKSAEYFLPMPVYNANACIQLTHSAGFWNLQPSRNINTGLLSYLDALSRSLWCLVFSTSYFIGSCQWSLLRRMHQATQCNSQEAATPRSEMSAVLVIYTGSLKTQGKENGTRTLTCNKLHYHKKARNIPLRFLRNFVPAPVWALHFLLGAQGQQSSLYTPVGQGLPAPAGADALLPLTQRRPPRPGLPPGLGRRGHRRAPRWPHPACCTQLAGDFFAAYLTYYKK